MRRARLAAAAAGVVALAAGGTALAAHGFSGPSKRAAPHVESFFGRRAVGPGGEFGAAAAYLGLSASDLLSQLRSGKTLAQVAAATSGKSAAGLIAALVAGEKTELAGAVTAGKLTQAQADRFGADLTQRITDLVDGTRPSFAAPAPGPGFGHGSGFGFGAPRRHWGQGGPFGKPLAPDSGGTTA